MRTISHILLTWLVVYYQYVYSQSLSKEYIDKIKEATVYIEMQQRFVLTENIVSSSGSGFLISPHGHIVTNYHVIRPIYILFGTVFPAPITHIRVVRNSGTPQYKSYTATVLTVDKENDLAILSITDSVALPFLEIATDTKPRETSPIWVFGYPFGDVFAVIQRGPEITITRGDITALRHDDRQILHSIQIDAKVNPGNSGGPLINEAGKVIGIVNMSGGSTGMNFAIPVHFLQTLQSRINLKQPVPDSVVLSVYSEPTGASIFVDWKPVGTTPAKQIKIPSGWRTFCVKKNGYESWIEERTLSNDDSIHAILKPIEPRIILHHADKKIKKGIVGRTLYPPSKQQESFWTEMILPVIQDSTNLIFNSNFHDTEEFVNMEQSTGGTNKRTWFQADNALHQHEADGALHAIYMGDRKWGNYIIQARVRITETPADGRAGIIFRENENGFYLFRIHRATNKAQLAYHCKQPFGWFIIMEKPLNKKITDEWHTLTVYADQQYIACFLDTIGVFFAEAKHALHGRIGFYSVDCKASFDSLFVFRINSPSPLLPALLSTDNVLSFWFTDHFNMHSTWWYQYASKEATPRPWYFSEGGMALERNTESQRYFSEFTRYHISDFAMYVMVSLEQGQNNSYFDILFRKQAEQYMMLRFSKKTEEVQLIIVNNSSGKMLKRSALPSGFFNATQSIQINVKDNYISCKTPHQMLMEYTGRKIPIRAGSFGFAAHQLRLVLHQLNVSSFPDQLEGQKKRRK